MRLPGVMLVVLAGCAPKNGDTCETRHETLCTADGVTFLVCEQRRTLTWREYTCVAGCTNGSCDLSKNEPQTSCPSTSIGSADCRTLSNGKPGQARCAAGANPPPGLDADVEGVFTVSQCSASCVEGTCDP